MPQAVIRVQANLVVKKLNCRDRPLSKRNLEIISPSHNAIVTASSKPINQDA
jgi:hypothetical protein